MMLYNRVVSFVGKTPNLITDQVVQQVVSCVLCITISNYSQPSVADQIPHQIQEQQQIFLPINNPVLQPATAAAAHVMPTPTTNWSMETMPWKITKTDQTGEVMEFTAHTPFKDNAMRRALLHQKRKSELNATTGTLPVKQFISEEKFTAHFNGLHISSDYIQHNAGDNMAADDTADDVPSTSGKCFSNLTYEDYQVTAKELEEKLRKANRITICEELKKFHDEQNKVTYLPETLLHRIDKPCTALVLWQPPPPIMNMFTQQQNLNMDSENDSLQRQQNERASIADYTIPDVDLPPERDEDIDDYIDNNNTCNLDFNNIKPDSMDEDL